MPWIRREVEVEEARTQDRPQVQERRTVACRERSQRTVEGLHHWIDLHQHDAGAGVARFGQEAVDQRARECPRRRPGPTHAAQLLVTQSADDIPGQDRVVEPDPWAGWRLCEDIGGGRDGNADELQGATPVENEAWLREIPECLEVALDVIRREREHDHIELVALAVTSP